jgi:ADP-ribose pyrophosphatase YjhB (NUDIX family)
MRALVGHRPLVLVSAGVLAFNARGWLLLHRRTDDGNWDMPGGCLEPGETLEEAARRDVREETGLALGALTLLRVFSGPEMFRQYPNGDQAYHVAAVTARGTSRAARRRALAKPRTWASTPWTHCPSRSPHHWCLCSPSTRRQEHRLRLPPGTYSPLEIRGATRDNGLFDGMPARSKTRRLPRRRHRRH